MWMPGIWYLFINHIFRIRQHLVNKGLVSRIVQRKLQGAISKGKRLHSVIVMARILPIHVLQLKGNMKKIQRSQNLRSCVGSFFVRYSSWFWGCFRVIHYNCTELLLATGTWGVVEAEAAKSAYWSTLTSNILQLFFRRGTWLFKTQGTKVNIHYCCSFWPLQARADSFFFFFFLIL